MFIELVRWMPSCEHPGTCSSLGDTIENASSLPSASASVHLIFWQGRPCEDATQDLASGRACRDAGGHLFTAGSHAQVVQLIEAHRWGVTALMAHNPSKMLRIAYELRSAKFHRDGSPSPDQQRRVLVRFSLRWAITPA